MIYILFYWKGEEKVIQSFSSCLTIFVSYNTIYYVSGKVNELSYWLLVNWRNYNIILKWENMYRDIIKQKSEQTSLGVTKLNYDTLYLNLYSYSTQNIHLYRILWRVLSIGEGEKLSGPGAMERCLVTLRRNSTFAVQNLP